MSDPFFALGETLTPDLVAALALMFLCLASMLGGVMRTVLLSLLALRLVRFALLPLAGAGAMSFFF